MESATLELITSDISGNSTSHELWCTSIYWAIIVFTVWFVLSVGFSWREYGAVNSQTHLQLLDFASLMQLRVAPVSIMAVIARPPITTAATILPSSTKGGFFASSLLFRRRCPALAGGAPVRFPRRRARSIPACSSLSFRIGSSTAPVRFGIRARNGLLVRIDSTFVVLLSRAQPPVPSSHGQPLEMSPRAPPPLLAPGIPAPVHGKGCLAGLRPA
ncbi:hypothetical protein AWZ03_014744 [Drosophila navojoa]|uniref:Uncharacterized protein n=1 Tax=Drosophila navojoa TaxID=7232 RepID=A0A484AQ84_DRONA|nr:hypothetical protein AWZ03_014744 [Drosophila navojoa]